MTIQTMFWIIIICNIVTLVCSLMLNRLLRTRINVLETIVNLSAERIANLERHELGNQ